MPSFDQGIVWLIVGLIGGSVAGILVKRQRRGFGIIANLALGLIGALVGGLIFSVFGLFPSLAKIAISLRDIVAALAGSVLVLIAHWAIKHFTSTTGGT